MRRLLIIFLIIAMMIGIVAADWYPVKIRTDVGTIKNNLGEISIQYIGNAAGTSGPETGDDDQLFANVPCNQTTNINKSSFTAQPDYTRNLVATFNATTNASIKILGTDIGGNSISENITISNRNTGVTTKAFKTVTRVYADLNTGETSKTLKLGTGDLLGLNTMLSMNTVLWAFLGTTKEGTAPTVTTNSTVLSLNTADLSSSYDGSPVRIYYIV